MTIENIVQTFNTFIKELQIEGYCMVLKNLTKPSTFAGNVKTYSIKIIFLDAKTKKKHSFLNTENTFSISYAAQEDKIKEEVELQVVLQLFDLLRNKQDLYNFMTDGTDYI